MKKKPFEEFTEKDWLEYVEGKEQFINALPKILCAAVAVAIILPSVVRHFF